MEQWTKIRVRIQAGECSAGGQSGHREDSFGLCPGILRLSAGPQGPLLHGDRAGDSTAGTPGREIPGETAQTTGALRSPDFGRIGIRPLLHSRS